MMPCSIPSGESRCDVVDSVLLIGLLALMSVLGVGAAFFNFQELWVRRRRLDRQLVEYGAIAYEARLKRASVLFQFGSRIDQSRWARHIQEMLENADLPLKPSEWVLMVIGLGVILLFFLAVLLRINLAFSLVVSFVGTIFVPKAYLQSRRNHYIEAFEGQLAEASLLLGNSLRAGLSIQQSVAVVSREMPPPSGREFAILYREMVLGSSSEEAITRMTERLPSNELKVLMTAILVQARLGGNLAKALSEMAYAMSKRRELHDEVRTLMAEPRFVATIVPLLPVGLLILMRNSMPEMVNPLFDTPLGWVILAVFAGLQVLAFYVTHSIADIEV